MNADFLENVTEADWETMAAHSGIDPAGLRNKIEAAVKAYQPPPGPVPVELKLLNEVDVSGANSKPFEFEIGNPSSSSR